MQKLLLFLLLAVVAGCQKNHRTEPDSEAPVIQVIAPTSNQSYTVGQAVTVSAHITDNERIEEVHLEIVNTTTNATYTHEHFAPASAGFDLLRVVNLPVAGTYKIRIEAENTLRNDGEVEIPIRVN